MLAQTPVTKQTSTDSTLAIDTGADVAAADGDRNRIVEVYVRSGDVRVKVGDDAAADDGRPVAAGQSFAVVTKKKVSAYPSNSATADITTTIYETV